MMCYKDKTFCSFWASCADGHGCKSALTEEVFVAAALWWGNTDAPICQYAEKPECFSEKVEPK